jgi:beta-mannanase
LAQVLWFITFDDPFPTDTCQTVRTHNAVPQVTWELFKPSINGNNTAASATYLNDVLGGKYDQYIDTFAAAAKSYDDVVMIRFLHEFNGNWYVWGGAKNGAAKGGPEKVKKVWQYVVDRFRAVGATKVQWVWCPHGPTKDVPTDSWNDIAAYWPGENYVDWLGMDAYNWYPNDPWGGTRPYQDFDTAFGPLYEKLIKMSTKPVCISETSSSSDFEYNGTFKADWVRNTFVRIKQAYPQIRLFSWFNINKEKDWRVDSDPETEAAFRLAMADPYFTSDWADPHK